VRKATFAPQMPQEYAARVQSITSLKGFHISPSFYSEDDDIMNELADRLLIDGTKVYICNGMFFLQQCTTYHNNNI